MDLPATLAIIVNYKVAGLSLGAVQSVLDSKSVGPVKIVLADNSENPEEAAFLRAGLPPEVDLLVNRNLGFGRACNIAFERCPAEFILLLNPDAGLLPDCLLELQQALLSHKKVAAVGPKIFWDDALNFCLPPSFPPEWLKFHSILCSRDTRMARCLSALWRRYAVHIWSSGTPVGVRNLSGGNVLLKREAVQKAGGLFDPRFFLYYEDSDLFFRLKKAGFDLLVIPGARVIHYYNQSEKQNPEKKERFMAESRIRFLEKNSTRGDETVRAILELVNGTFKTMNSSAPLCFRSPFCIEVPEKLQDDWLFEWSPHPHLVPAVGCFGKGPRMDFTEGHWSMLAPGRYYGRLGSPRQLLPRGAMISWVV